MCEPLRKNVPLRTTGSVMSVPESIPSLTSGATSFLRVGRIPDTSTQPRGKRSSRPNQTSVRQVHFKASKKSQSRGQGTPSTGHGKESMDFMWWKELKSEVRLVLHLPMDDLGQIRHHADPRSPHRQNEDNLSAAQRAKGNAVWEVLQKMLGAGPPRAVVSR